MTRSLVLCAFLFVSGVVEISYAAQFQDCGSRVGHFTQVTVSDCDSTKAACDLVRGTNASLSIDFVPSEDVTKIEAVVHGVIANVPVPFPFSQPDVCMDHNSNIQCPLKKDSSYTYKAILPVRHEYPKVSVKVKWQLKDQNNQDIICVLIPARIR